MTTTDDRPRGLDMDTYDRLSTPLLKEVNAWFQSLPRAQRSATRIELLNAERTRVRVTHYVPMSPRGLQITRDGSGQPVQQTTELTAPEPFPAAAIFVLGPAQ